MSAAHAPEPRELDDEARERGEPETERLRAEHDRSTALATIGLGALMVVMAVAVLVQATQLPATDSTVGPATLMWVVGALLFVVGGMTVRTGRRDLGRRDTGGRDTGSGDTGGDAGGDTGEEDTGRPDDGGRLPGHASEQDWPRMLALLGLLVVFAVALGWVGYVVSATFLFGTSAIVLGARRRLRSFAYGWSIAVVVYLVFDTGIGLTLPAGPWGF